MAKNKIERIDQEITKVREKIAEYQEKLKTLETQKTEAENLEIVQMVRALRMTPAPVSYTHLDVYKRQIKSRLKRPLPAPTAQTKKENPRRTVSPMNGCGRTGSAVYRTATIQRPFSFRTSTISYPKTKIRPRSLRAGVISSIILTVRSTSSCLF